MYHKSIVRKGYERKVKRCAAMRAAKERKRIRESFGLDEVGRILFDGPAFGGSHMIRLLRVSGVDVRLKSNLKRLAPTLFKPGV